VFSGCCFFVCVVVVYFSRCVCVCRNFPWHTNSIWNITAYNFSLTLLSFYSSSFRPVKKKKKKNGTLISVWTSVANHSCWCRGKYIYDFKQNVFPPFPKKKNWIIFKKWTTRIARKRISTPNWNHRLFPVELKKTKEFPKCLLEIVFGNCKGRKEVARHLMAKVGRK
jgi:hypothetical protein